MKKLFTLMLMLLVIASNCFAMTFYQPIEIGEFGYGVQSPIGGYSIKGATSNNGNYYTKNKKDNTRTYGKGMAIFGEGNDSISIHYDFDNLRGIKCGDKNISNSVLISTGPFGNILQIKNDSEITFYYMSFGYKYSHFYIIGKRKDGRWIKYIDSSEIEKKYSTKASFYGPQYPPLKGTKNLKNIYCQNDTIIVPYGDHGDVKLGEFRFKWDDAAQWFGVEQVVY